MSGRVLITGATSGIGRQLALDYRRSGWQVWGCGRDGERLQALADEGIIPLQFDGRDSAAMAVIAADLPALDLLILNAGNCEYMDLVEGFDGALFARVIETNLIATGHALAAFLPRLVSGSRLAIVGSSGSGKTTLMNMIGCMDTPSKGSVMLEGRKLEDLNAKQLADVRKNMIGLVFQKFYLVPHLTAVENVMVAQYYHSVVDEKQAMEALEKVGLKDRAHHLPGQLSGGEQQRVSIARALINDPKLILADEPTGNLDEKNEKIVLDLFRKLHEQGTTIIVVTHDALVASCAQREIMLNHGVLVGEQWNDEEAKRAYEAAGGKPAHTGSAEEGAQNGGVAILFADPTKAAKTGDTDADADGTEGERA